jgi:AraC-like DNA-binding protein
MRTQIAEKDEKWIPAWLQPLSICDLLSERQIELNSVLNGSGLFIEDFPFEQSRLNAKQFERLLENASHIWGRSEFSFQFGHYFLRSKAAQVKPYIEKIHTVSDLVSCVTEFQGLFSPSIHIRSYQAGSGDYFLLFKSNHDQTLKQAPLRTVFSLCVSLIHSCLTDTEITLYSTEKKPKDIEHFHAFVPTNSAYFSSPLNSIRIRSKLHNMQSQLWMEENTALRNSYAEMVPKRSFLGTLQDALWESSSASCNLNELADTMNTSPATIKRRLSQAQTRFQHLQDTIRMERAILDLLVLGASVDDLSSQLHFHDSSNFRRAFKRWTGLTPNALKAKYQEYFTITGA